MDILNNHKNLYGIAVVFFIALSVAVVILPALYNQNNNAPLPGSAVLTGDVLAGKHVFIANGCVSCHTQQVRNIDMDKPWGTRPSVAADYANNSRMDWWMNTATLMGTERTGPDLTNIGNRLPSADWHLLHLFNPRAVVEASIMPAYAWMFEWKEKAGAHDRVVNVPENFLNGRNEKLVATKEAIQLVAYLQSLRQTPMPEAEASPAFLYKKEPNPSDAKSGGESIRMDGGLLYQNNCQACHQANGEGIKGAFPPLKGSAVVLDDSPEILIDIILSGYNGREEYGEMPAVGTLNRLTAEEIAAIINHERSSWGNKARNVSAIEVEKVMGLLNSKKVLP